MSASSSSLFPSNAATKKKYAVGSKKYDTFDAYVFALQDNILKYGMPGMVNVAFEHLPASATPRPLPASTSEWRKLATVRHVFGKVYYVVTKQYDEASEQPTFS